MNSNPYIASIRRPWADIHSIAGSLPGSKLLLLVRHGQAISNWLQDTLGPDEWFQVEGTCSYEYQNTTWNVRDTASIHIYIWLSCRVVSASSLIRWLSFTPIRLQLCIADFRTLRLIACCLSSIIF